MERDRLDRAVAFLNKRTPGGGEIPCSVTLKESVTDKGKWCVLFHHDASTEWSKYETTDPVAIDVTYEEAVKEFVRVIEMELNNLQPTEEGGE